MKRRDLISTAMGAVAASALAAGIAVAAIPAADGEIHGCYQKNEGQLRVIDSDADSCRPSELPISWNAQGPQGIQGPQGERGLQGEQGPPGADGADGTNGQPGADGVTDTTLVTATFGVAGGSFASAVVACPAARPNVLGGGYSLPDSVGNLADVLQNRPLGGEDGWLVRVRSGAQNSFDVTAWAVCG